jgi:hypothetical protein
LFSQGFIKVVVRVREFEIVRDGGANVGVALAVAVLADVGNKGVDDAELEAVNFAAIGEAELHFLGLVVLHRRAREEVEVVAAVGLV